MTYCSFQTIGFRNSFVCLNSDDKTPLAGLWGSETVQRNWLFILRIFWQSHCPFRFPHWFHTVPHQKNNQSVYSSLKNTSVARPTASATFLGFNFQLPPIRGRRPILLVIVRNVWIMKFSAMRTLNLNFWRSCLWAIRTVLLFGWTQSKIIWKRMPQLKVVSITSASYCNHSCETRYKLYHVKMQKKKVQDSLKAVRCSITLTSLDCSKWI